MAQTATNRWKYLFSTGGVIPGTTDIRMGLLQTNAGATNVPDLNTVAEMEAHADFAELTVAGYARIALTSVTATEDDANDRVNIDSANVAFTSLAAGQNVVGAFIFDNAGGADASRNLYGIYDVTSTATNGGDITIAVADFVRLV